MSALVLTTAKIQIATSWTGTAPGAPGTQTVSGTLLTNVTDISAYVKSVAIPLTAATQDATTFGSGGYAINLAGLKSGALNLSFVNDLAAAAIDSILWSTFGLGTSVNVDIMPTSSARGASNPSYVCQVILANYTGVNAAVGSVNMFDATWPITGAFARLTS